MLRLGFLHGPARKQFGAGRADPLRHPGPWPQTRGWHLLVPRWQTPAPTVPACAAPASETTGRALTGFSVLCNRALAV